MSSESFVLPARSKVGYLDPAIAAEGQSVFITSDGDTVAYSEPPKKPVIPDMSEIKSIKKYFAPRPHRAFPAWLYHPTDAPVLVKDAEEAAELGVCYRDATDEERSRYGLRQVWDWKDGVKWRPEPYKGTPTFDPAKPGHGKTVVRDVNPAVAQNALVEALIPQVAAAVATALRSSGPAAPASIDAKQWDAFLAFQAFQKTQEAVHALSDEMPPEEVKAHHVNALASALSGSDEDDRAELEAEAISLGMKIDKRWSLATLRTEVSKTQAMAA